MERILVMGVSAGAGKSTFARELGARLAVPVHYLDSFYFEEGWREVPRAQFEARQKKAADGDRWIIEGNYSSTLFCREGRADTVIYLELPLYLCLFRVLKRRIRYHGKTRPDLAENCPEKLDRAFLHYILKTYRLRKRSMRQRMETYRKKGRTVVILTSRRQIRRFLQTAG